MTKDHDLIPVPSTKCAYSHPEIVLSPGITSPVTLAHVSEDRELGTLCVVLGPGVGRGASVDSGALQLT
jgi:hypothetical protein